MVTERSRSKAGGKKYLCCVGLKQGRRQMLHGGDQQKLIGSASDVYDRLHLRIFHYP
ncbi:MAG: hypothetical protein V7K48_13995 [Nostoc sp.]|uniref:hypothetical protein n=1 Tax=Nostoc sp. TaxID=1180 RepID=UPI002FF7E468